MALTLNPGFRATVQIQDEKQNVLYEKSCPTDKDVQDFIKQYARSKPGWSMLRGAAIPLRTNNLKNFSTDFFIPTYAHYSSKINRRALRIFASIFALIFDGISLPIRFVATPFRVGYNVFHKEEVHPLMPLIKEKAKNCSIVNLSFVAENITVKDLPKDEDGSSVQKGMQTKIEGTAKIALKRMPGGIKSKSSQNSSVCSYLIMNGEWTPENSSQGSSTHYSFSC